jgi:hypothetical protein
VRFTGTVSEDELYKLYGDCDVFCLPSRYESFGLVLLEAMMFAKPVVGVKIGGMQEIVEVNGNGFLAEPESAAALEECLRPLIEDAELRARFGRRSRQLYETKFSAEIMAANTLAYYADIAAGRYPRLRPGKEARAVRIGRMVREFASIIAEATCVPAAAAEKLAQYFLSVHKHGQYVDYLTHISHLLPRSDGRFVSALYQLLLGREETPQELAEGVYQLRHGVARGYLVQQLAMCDEAKQMGLPTAYWLTRAMAAGGVPNVIIDGVPAAPAGRLPNVRARLKFFSNVMRYLKRLVLLPWNFAKLHHSFHEQQVALREQLEAQKRDLQQAMHEQARELRTVIGAQLNELRDEMVRLQKPAERYERRAA